jgi:pyruvate carboxylase
MTVHEFENLPPDHSLNIPNSVVEMFEGSLGEPEGGWPKKIARVILRGGKPRAAARRAPAPSTSTKPRAQIEKKTGAQASDDRPDELPHVPRVSTSSSQSPRQLRRPDVLPTRPFFYGMKTGDEITVELEPGKTSSSNSSPSANRTRTATAPCSSS